MDSKVFDYFLTVSRYRSFARAAQELHISPQGLGNSMRRLEREFGVPLFNDMYGTGELTEYGELLLEYAQQISGSLRDLHHGMDVLVAHSRNVIKLGCSLGLLGYLGEHVIDDFNAASRDSQVLVASEVPDLRCEQGLVAGEYDLAFLVNPPSGDLIAVPIVDDYQFFWVHVNNRLSKKDSIELEDLDGQTIATVDDGFKSTDRLMILLEQRGIKAEFTFTSEMMRVYEWARMSRALGLTCRNHIEATADSTKTVGLPFASLPWGFSLCYRRDHMLSEAETQFVDYMRSKRRTYE